MRLPFRRVLCTAARSSGKDRDRGRAGRDCGPNTPLAAIGLPRSTWYYWKNQKVDYEKKYANLLLQVIEILREPTGYGYRRSLRDSKDRGYPVDQRVIHRILKMRDPSSRRWAGIPKAFVPRRILAKKGPGMDLAARMGKPSLLEVFYRDFTPLVR